MVSKEVTKWLHYDRINQVINISHDLPADHPLGLNYLQWFTIKIYHEIEFVHIIMRVQGFMKIKKIRSSVDKLNDKTLSYFNILLQPRTETRITTSMPRNISTPSWTTYTRSLKRWRRTGHQSLVWVWRGCQCSINLAASKKISPVFSQSDVNTEQIVQIIQTKKMIVKSSLVQA